MKFDDYDMIRAAIRSRLLFNSEDEYRDLLGVTMETVRDSRGDDEAVERYSEALDRECLRQSGIGIYTMLRCLVEASAAVTGQIVDWRERRQMASRKKFCRWLFRQVAAPWARLSVKEEGRYSPRDCDTELLSMLYPDGVEGGSRIDPVMLMLVTFGVVRPFSMSGSRSHDVTPHEAAGAIAAMRRLVEQLWEDIPGGGVIAKPNIFNVVTGELEAMEPTDYSPARMWDLLNRILAGCRATGSPQEIADGNLVSAGYSMPGIWVDDGGDAGEGRFWIFPENLLIAFCYSRRDGRWEMTPVEFVFFKDISVDVMGDYCSMVTARGNRRLLRDEGGVLDPTDVVTMRYRLSGEETDGRAELRQVEFLIDPARRPEWMTWQSFSRLDCGSVLYRRYLATVADLYDRSTPDGILFKSRAGFMTDFVNAIVAVDNDYVYVSDRPIPPRYVMVHDEAYDCFRYLPSSGSDAGCSLRSVEVSDSHPLYLLPRRVAIGPALSERQRQFIEACHNTGIDSHVTIYHVAGQRGGFLCFNDFSLVFTLSDNAAEITRYGAIRISRREDIFA